MDEREVPGAREAARAEEAREDLLMAADRFEDRFTGATGDFSVGGVAEALDEMRDEEVAVERQSMPETAFQEALPAGETPASLPAPRSRAMRPRGIPAASGALALALGVGGVWAFVRWRRERNRPANRLRRRASRLAREVNQRLPDREAVFERLPDARTAAPGGAGTLLLAAGLLAWRLLRSSNPEPTEMPSADEAASVAEEIRTRLGRISVRPPRAAEGIEQVSRSAVRAADSGFAARGLVGVGVATAGGYLLWRLLRGQPDAWIASSGEQG